ncbi:hypothetical protein FIBSPDRAFT_1015410, partial [Athelia psychrophila]
ISVMGPTGAGKSTFIEYVTQLESGGSVRHGLQPDSSVTQAVRTKHPKDQDPITFIDTPGFDDAKRTDTETLAQIASWFAKVYKEKISISAIIYLHRISDNRIPGSPLKNLQMFSSMCGQAAMPHVILATTMWSETKPETGARREEELKGFWADMITQGCIVQRFEDSNQSAWEIVGKLPTKQLSHKIYDKTNLKEIAVRLANEMNKLIADRKEAARRMEEQVNSENNPVLVAELQEWQAEIEAKIVSVAIQLQLARFAQKSAQKIANFLTGKKARKAGV